MQQMDRPPAYDEAAPLALRCEEISRRMTRERAEAGRPSAAEGRLLTSFFVRITRSSDRAAILKLAKALADRAEPSEA